MADIGLQVVALEVRLERHSSCAAEFWPRAQMSSRPPSTVGSAVCRMAPQSTLRPRWVKRPSASSALWNARSMLSGQNSSVRSSTAQDWS
jgi:hypothetical protein